MTLDDLRHDIDKIDTKILTLLNERMERALLTRRFKTTTEDKDREQALLERIRHASHNLVNPEFATTLYTEILSESKRLQEKNPLTIGFQGEHGAFSEMAALAYNSEIVTIPCREFIDVFEGVESGLYTYGIVPVENTLGGLVEAVNAYLINTNLKIVAAVNLPVRHCLVAPQGADHRELRFVWSHSQALTQCRNFILRNHLEPIPYYDTAGAARAIAESQPKDVAAISSRLAAELYGLDIIKEDVQDFKNNRTRFFVLAKDATEKAGDKCSIVFTAGDKAGSLFAVLEVFAKAGINLTRIESIPDKPGTYAIFIDLEGSAEDPCVSEALEKASNITKGYRLLGCYREVRTTL